MGTKKLCKVLLIAFFAITVSTISYAQENRILMTSEQQYQNMVPNSSFESWDSTNTKPADWTKIDTPTLTQDASVKRIGANALMITSAAGTTSQGVSYAVTVEPKTTYTFSCYYYSAALNQAELAVVGNVTANLVVDTVLTSTSGAWKRYSVTFTTVTDTSATIKLYAKADAGGAKSAYFDAVALSEGNSTPAFTPHAITDTGNHTMYGGLTVEGTADLKGAVNLGDLSTDNITLKGTLKSDAGANVTLTPPSGQTVSITQGGLSVVGTVTADGLTLGANENITLGAQTIKHDGTDFQFSDAIDLGTNVLDDTNLGYFLGWKHASDGSKIDGGDIYTGTVTTTQIGTDTILAGDIATGAIATAEILDGTIVPSDIGIIRASSQATADKTAAIASGAVYVSGNALLNYAGGTANFALGGNLAYTPTAANKYVKALVTLNSSGVLSKTMGAEKDTASAAQDENLTYPIDELPIAEIILKTTGVTAGDVANIESSAGANSYIYRDVRPLVNLGGGSNLASNTFTVGSNTDETANDISLVFGNTTGGQQTLTYAGAGASSAVDMFKFSDDLMISSSADSTSADVVLSFGGTNPETLKFTGAGTDNFVFSDVVDAAGFEVSGTALAATHLSDGAQIAHINAIESVTGGWAFDTAATTFNSDVNMVYAGAENLAITSAASSAVDAVTLDVTSSNTGVVRGIVLTQNATSTQPVDVGLEILNLDSDTAMATAIKITATGAITTGLDLGATTIANSGNITGSGALTLSSGSSSDLGVTGTNGVNITATAQDIALAATTATNGGVNIAGPSASIDVGVAADGVIDVDSTSVTIDKADAGTLKLRSGTTEYLALGTDEAITLGNSATPAALTVNASTLSIVPTDNSTVKIATNKTFAVNDHNNAAIISMDDATRTLSVYNLDVNGTQTVINTTTTDADHFALSPGAVGTTAISIVPNSGITLTGNLITAKKVSTDPDVFVVDKDGNITTAGTYKGFTIGHSTHAQNTDTGTTGAGFTLASATDAAANNVTLTLGGTNQETIIFDGVTTDDFIFSDKVVAGGFDAQSAGITNVGNISDDANINIDLTGATDKTLAIQNSGTGVTNVTVDGSLTAAQVSFDNSTLNSETWTTAGGANITLSPAGAKVLPGSHESYDLGASAAIGSPAFSGTGTLTMTVTSYDAYVDVSKTYVVKLDAAGNIGAATFKWSRDNGGTWVQTGRTTSASDIPLENGIAVKFGGTAGALNDQWSVAVTANTGWRAAYAKKVSTDSIYTSTLYPEAAGGSITIQGDLNVTGAQTITGGTQYQGSQTITATSATAFLVESGAGTDAFIIDTSTPQVNVLTNLDVSGTIKGGTDDAFQVAASGAITGVGLNAGAGLITTSGNITTTGSGAITAANGLTVTAGGATITAGGLNNSNSGITNAGAISGATTIVASNYLRSLASVGLIPEYDNATPRPDGSDNFGTLSLQYANSHNYYEWATSEPTTQDYDIVIRYRLPDGFSSFDVAAPIKLWNKVSADPGSTKVDVTMLDTAGASVTLTGGSTLQNTSWTETTITLDATGKTLTPGGYITLIIKMSAGQGKVADVGELTLKGNW